MVHGTPPCWRRRAQTRPAGPAAPCQFYVLEQIMRVGGFTANDSNLWGGHFIQEEEVSFVQEFLEKFNVEERIK